MKKLEQFLVPVIVTTVVASVSIAFASLTFTGTAVNSDSAVNIDSISTLSIGATSSTAITVGRSGVATTFPGSVAVSGTTTLQNVVVEGTCAGCDSAPVLVSTSTGPISDPGGSSYYQFNNSSGALTFDAPDGVAGTQRCYRNATGVTGAITVQMASGNTVDVNGANGSSGGTLMSGGALGDAICIISDSAHHWYAYIQSGSWLAN